MIQFIKKWPVFGAVSLLASGPPLFAAYNIVEAPLFAAGLLLCGLMPIAIAFLIFRSGSYWVAWGWILPVLAHSYLVLYAVRTSESSTASLDFLFLPAWNIAIVGPIGAFIGYLVVRLRSGLAVTSTLFIPRVSESTNTPTARALVVLWVCLGVGLASGGIYEASQWSADETLHDAGIRWWPVTGMVPSVLSILLAYQLYGGRTLVIGYFLSALLALCILLVLALTPLQFVVQPLLALKVLVVALCVATVTFLYRTSRR